MRARRATQVDRQVGQSGQLGHNQHSRAPRSTSIVSPDTTPTSRSLGHRVISSFVRVPARLAMSSEARLVSFALQNKNKNTSLPRTSLPRTSFTENDSNDRKGKTTHTHTYAPLQRETSHTTCRPQKPKRLGDRTLGIGIDGALVTLVEENAQHSSDRPVTCTSARAVATVECTFSEQNPMRDTRAPLGKSGGPYRCSLASHCLEMLAGGPRFLDSGIMACTVCRSGTIRASNASRLFISSSIDGSKDPTLTSDQSFGAATLPIHPDRVTRC
jgi:hypothetical protein